MDSSNATALLRSARSLRASLLVVLNHVDELCALIDDRVSSPPRSPSDTPPALPDLRVERAMFAVVWKGRTCYLGNTLPFRLIERIARRPGHYVSVNHLAEDLWDGPRAASTVRSVVCELRMKLKSAGMTELADRVDGSNVGHYGLRTGARPARSHSQPTQTRQRSDSVIP